MNNNMQKDSGDRAMKTFAIVGLIIVVILIAWIAIQVIQLVPGAFSSLASLADSVYDRQDDITLETATSESTVNSEESIELMWTDLESEGSYTFTYECTPGVTIEIRTETGSTELIECDSPYILDTETFSAELLFTSTRERFSDVPYTVTFTPEDTDEETKRITKTITVLNPTLARDDENGIEDEEDDTETTEPDEEIADTPETETEPVVRYRYVETPVYAIPTSDPNGYTELAVTFLSLGTLTKNNVFVPKQTLEVGERGAVQFEVKNIGTKTSKDWEFRANLPFSIRYNSKSQESLKPNERSMITIAFDNITKTSLEQIKVRISGGNDKSTHNNSFVWPVVITK